jgi:hypothetical protein
MHNQISENRPSTVMAMVHVPQTKLCVGSSQETRQALAEEYGFHPSLLDDELPAEEVIVPAFYIDEYPVTNEEYAAFLNQTGYREPLYWRQTELPERRDHPAVGISGNDAHAYAEWVGKRLPTAVQWEAAFQGAACARRQLSVTRQWLPPTQGKAAWQGIRSLHGVAGFGEVSEWTSDTTPHQETTFRLLKGPSWIFEEPWSLRKETAIWAFSLWGFVFTGFRCVSNSPVSPTPTHHLVMPAGGNFQSEESESLAPPETHLKYRGESSIELHFSEPSVRAALNCPETHPFETPDVPWFNGVCAQEPGNAQACKRLDYSLTDKGLTLNISLETAPDTCSLQYRLSNSTDRTEKRCVSTCVSLGGEPLLYDVEGTRTYCWLGCGEWLPLTTLPRTAWKCTRWYNGPARRELPEGMSAALLAVQSRDNALTFGYGWAGLEHTPNILNNFCFTCLHIDPIMIVEKGKEKVLNARLYCVRGTLDDLLDRFKSDFSLP